jgi:hypothetical protein
VTSPKESSASASVEAETKSSHNTAAIAAGVVIGVVGFAALCGAGFFFWRSKQNKTNAAFGGGTTGGYGRDSNPPSMSDSRFDGDYMAQRRQSNGSIDDDHDFSRRILQVNIPVNASPSSNAYYNSGDEPRSLNRLSYRFTHPSTLLPLSSVLATYVLSPSALRDSCHCCSPGFLPEL